SPEGLRARESHDGRALGPGHRIRPGLEAQALVSSPPPGHDAAAGAPAVGPTPPIPATWATLRAGRPLFAVHRTPPAGGPDLTETTPGPFQERWSGACERWRSRGGTRPGRRLLMSWSWTMTPRAPRRSPDVSGHTGIGSAAPRSLPRPPRPCVASGPTCWS